MLEEEKQPVSEGSIEAFQGLPKIMFFMGLFAGLALFSTVALGYLVWSVTTGKGILTAAPKQVAAAIPPTTDGAAQPQKPTPPPAKPVRGPDQTDHILGPSNAPVTLIEYSDFQCPFCRRHYQTVTQLLDMYKGKIRFVYRHFPLPELHPNAQKAAEASECAASLGGNDMFWKMYDKIFTADDLTVTGLKKLAKDIGLDEAKFNDCLDSGKMASKVTSQADEGSTFGVQGTPANFINGKEVAGGAQPISTYQTIIDGILKK
jgi:protein-disulfide isomerase